ncbi:MAG TPA: hypothetical protein VMT57_09710 [Candidatus Thermoplasmatota archaeon]|nr:hypothetical protein [Candidatus Thermoplasmatota archaeon]
MKGKIGIVIGLFVIIAVLATIVVYLLNAGTLILTELASVAIIMILVGFAAYVLWDRARNLRKGLPVKDERMIIISYRAGYYGFIAAIYSAVGAPVIYDILYGKELPGDLTTAAVVLISAFVFFVSYLYLAQKGKE